MNIVDETWLKEADRMGVISGNSEDKSEVFAYTIGGNGAPLINDVKISIECEMDGNYELENFDNFICKILAKECSVEEEVEMLKKCSFSEVKCLYSYHKFSVIIAVK